MNGLMLPSGKVDLISSQVLSAASVCDFTNLSSQYAEYVFDLTEIRASADELAVRLSTDNGSTYISSGTYAYAVNGTDSTPTNKVRASTVGTSILLDCQARSGGAITYYHGGYIKLFGHADTQLKTLVWHKFTTTAAGAIVNSVGSGSISNAGTFPLTTAINALRIFPLTGTISGTIKLYGIKAN